MSSRLPLLLLALVSLPSLAFGDLLTGRIIAPNGTGVAGVNINAFRSDNGNEEDNLFNDGTDASGNFSTTIPAGVWDLHFLPPGPPATTHVPLVLRNVVVSGTRALGTLQLQAGVSLGGRLVSQGGLPIGNVSIDVFEVATGFQIPQMQVSSNAFGNFALAVPQVAVELRIVPSRTAIPLYFSRRMTVTPAGNTSLGDIVLQDGFQVSGTVVRTVGGTGVAGLDLDFIDVATGIELWTPNDSTNSLGAFSTVVPAGTLDIELCPSLASRLVAKGLRQTVSATTNLGTITLDPGVLLSGTVRNFAGVAVLNADIDVSASGIGKVLTCNDNSSATGAYAVVVPAGTLRVTFNPPSYDVGLGRDLEKNLVVGADTVLDGVLPACDPATNYGNGLAGTGGLVPRLRMSPGVPSLGNKDIGFRLRNARGGSTGFLIVGFAPASNPVLGGTVLVSPQNAFIVPIALGGASGVAGEGTLDIPPQFSPALIGIDFFAQFFVHDPLAAQGWSFSNGVTFRVCR
ncbi:MAG TPA: hypothetical protein VF530_09205 [Planctomycetota bacterium]